MKTVQLSDEELAVITKLREETVKKKAAEQAEKAEEKKQAKLESEFRKIAKQAYGKINKHLDRAREELAKAVVVSNETGVPFQSNIVEFDRNRTYLPQLFGKWEDDIEDVVGILYEDFDVYVAGSVGDDGWELWNSSSFSC